MGYSIFITFILAAVLGRVIIPLLKKLKFGQTVRDDGPKTHLIKMGIPTMGGIIFLIPIIVVFLIINGLSNDSLVIATTVLLYAVVGFLDDIIKIKRKSKDGLSVLQKSIGLLIVSALFSYYIVYISSLSSNMILPFTQMENVLFVPKIIYFIALIFVMYLTTNSVNLTDGIDGLASSVTTVVMLFMMVIAYAVSNDSTVSVLSLTTIGGLLGFLLYNGYPAKVFMGDTGSLALGSIVAISAIYLQIPWVILVCGIIYVLEALSVVIQVGHYKRTKKRVFKMAPIHHHYELSGWNEKKVVVVFTIVTIVASFLAYAILIWL